MTVAVVCGGRYLKPSIRLVSRLTKELVENNVQEVIQGGAPGGDEFGKAVAKAIGLKCDRQFDADWNSYGKSAGPLRNEKMSNVADICIAMPGGRGTADMVSRMRAKNKIVVEVSDK